MVACVYHPDQSFCVPRDRNGWLVAVATDVRARSGQRRATDLIAHRNAFPRSDQSNRSKPSGKVRDTHSVGSICDHDFGVFTVANIATENTNAIAPAHSFPGMPKAANHGLQRCRAPRVPLTCLAPLAAWQSLCTGHVDAPLENSVARAFTDRDRPSGDSRYFRQPCVGALASLARQRGQLVNRRKRFTVGQDLGTLGTHYENVQGSVSGKENFTV